MGVQRRGKTPNTWTIRWYERDANRVNKQQRVAFHGTKAEALAEHGRLIGRSVRGLSPMARARTPFSVFCDEWLKHRRQRVMVESEEDEDISPTHWRTQESYIRLQIKPVLGSYKIGEIGPRQIDEAKSAWRSMKQKRKYVDKPLSPERFITSSPHCEKS